MRWVFLNRFIKKWRNFTRKFCLFSILLKNCNILVKIVVLGQNTSSPWLFPVLTSIFFQQSPSAETFGFGRFEVRKAPCLARPQRGQRDLGSQLPPEHPQTRQRRTHHPQASHRSLPLPRPRVRGGPQKGLLLFLFRCSVLDIHAFRDATPVTESVAVLPTPVCLRRPSGSDACVSSETSWEDTEMPRSSTSTSTTTFTSAPRVTTSRTRRPSSSTSSRRRPRTREPSSLRKYFTFSVSGPLESSVALNDYSLSFFSDQAQARRDKNKESRKRREERQVVKRAELLRKISQSEKVIAGK